jgi:acetoacetate decarboxylase
MKAEDVRRALTTPIGAPAYPTGGPYRFTDREYLNITYRTDVEAVRAVVPRAADGRRPAGDLRGHEDARRDGLGRLHRVGAGAHRRARGEPAAYLHAMYVDNLGSITSGREISAFPEEVRQRPAAPRRRHPRRARSTTAPCAWRPRRWATSTGPAEDEARAEITRPTYALKMLPGYDRRPRICELVRRQITDLTVKGAWTGPARLQLFEHALAPLADLPVREIVSASHILCDLTLGRPTVVHDYLEGCRAPTRSCTSSTGTSRR